jgi:hypothetical protein
MFPALFQKRAFSKQGRLPALTRHKPFKKRPHTGQLRRETSTSRAKLQGIFPRRQALFHLQPDHLATSVPQEK